MTSYDFSEVTYTYYSETMGRSFVPSEKDFNNYRLENVALLNGLLPFLEELETDGLTKAACLCVEVDYLDAQKLSGNGTALAGESVQGHSVNYDNTERDKLAEANTLSTAAKKLGKIKLFCSLNTGVR